ncbi:DUF4239 domain-containing protein [Streptomyces sp. AP-93]|uniref:bestrophin-like domain n=1 Tax=Streptomyces sp. AP-93 TaxID=2929048 RepID=UPI001FAF6620|nr:DUF4239 domain-containing protein [Streptomyces sp. AP-93]MCJ0870663.1 DUF4239 domain-containing protein [Streptomyces sp. AP-93]
MALWLLNHLSTWSLAVLVVGGVSCMAVLGSFLTRRFFPQVTDGEHNEMVGVVLGMFGAIYGIILAFVVVTLWTQLETTQAVVSAEATDLAVLLRDIRVFPAEDRARITTAVSGYVHAVVEVQWPLMREGRPSFAATGGDLERVYAALQRYVPENAAQQSFYDSAVDRLADVAAQRRARLATARQQLPPLLQVLVFGGALVILPLTFLYGIRSKKMQVLFVASVAALIGFSLLLVLVLDRPFAGELSVNPSAYKDGVLAQLWRT